MANAIGVLRRGRTPAASRWIGAAILTGIGFLVIKAVEYSEKIQHGIGFGDDIFFTLYFALTGFHMAHVLAGVLILLFLRRSIRRGRYDQEDHLDVESGGIFWHMCDIIWLLIYPIVYLL
jgi:nitric oxide reductase NorE protein